MLVEQHRPMPVIAMLGGSDPAASSHATDNEVGGSSSHPGLRSMSRTYGSAIMARDRSASLRLQRRPVERIKPGVANLIFNPSFGLRHRCRLDQLSAYAARFVLCCDPNRFKCLLRSLESVSSFLKLLQRRPVFEF
jgi:hypothetical protein